MEQISLSKRDNNCAHSAKKERNKGMIPGVIYGKKLGNLLFEVGQLELNKELSMTGEHGVLNYDLDGHSGTAVIKEVQKDAVSHEIIHIDLEDVYESDTIKAEVPLKFVGKDFLNTKGVVIQAQRDSVKVECKPEDLPSAIELNVTNAKPGMTYKMADLEVASEISIVDDLSTVLASTMYNSKVIGVEDNDEESVAEIVINNEKK